MESLTACTCSPSYFTFHRDEAGKIIRSRCIPNREQAERALERIQRGLDANRARRAADDGRIIAKARAEWVTEPACGASRLHAIDGPWLDFVRALRHEGQIFGLTVGYGGRQHDISWNDPSFLFDLLEFKRRMSEGCRKCGHLTAAAKVCIQDGRVINHTEQSTLLNSPFSLCAECFDEVLDAFDEKLKRFTPRSTHEHYEQEFERLTKHLHERIAKLEAQLERQKEQRRRRDERHKETRRKRDEQKAARATVDSVENDPLLQEVFYRPLAGRLAEKLRKLDVIIEHGYGGECEAARRAHERIYRSAEQLVSTKPGGMSWLQRQTTSAETRNTHRETKCLPASASSRGA